MSFSTVVGFGEQKVPGSLSEDICTAEEHLRTRAGHGWWTIRRPSSGAVDAVQALELTALCDLRCDVDGRS
jgi:hypothetical protein